VQGVIADSTVEHFPAPSLSQEIRERSRYTDEQVGFWRWAHGEDWEQVVRADSDFLLRFEDDGGDCFHGRLKQIQCPVLLSASLGDTSLPDGEAQLQQMHAQLGNSRLFFAPTGSHPSMWSKADMFRREADIFLASLTAEDNESL
jgi:pimeloyl-ACP methyl ester carboxylesterase